MKSANRTIFIAPKCTARRRILVAGMGTSPAVLTETVWALAHQGRVDLFVCGVESNYFFITPISGDLL